MQFSNFKFVSKIIGLCILFTISGFTQSGDSKGEAQFLSNVRQLIYDGKRSGEGYFSPDGKLMTFQSEREAGNPFFQIYILDFESGESHRVSPGTGKTTCSFIRPGADEVLFASSHLDPDAVKDQEEEIALRKSGQERRYSWDYDVHMDIFSTKLDGSGIKQLTDAYGYDAEASYSPDGSKIVFGSLRNGYPADKLSPEDRKRMDVDPAYFGEIYIMNADGSNQTRLTDWPGYDGGPFFSPDGKLIIWRHFDESGMQADVYTMKLDGSDRRRLTDFGAMSWAPYFHPSQKYVVFASNKLGFSNFEVFMVDAAGEKEPVRVTFTDGFDGLPVFMPDGKKMVWTSSRTPGGESQLFIANWNHEAALAALAAAPPRNSGNDASMGSTLKAQPAAIQAVYVGMITAEARHEFSPEVSASDLRENVEYLASDELEGRLTGTPGTQKAAAYIANQFKKLGLKPLGDSGTYFQEFPFTSGVKIVAEKNSMALVQQGDKAATNTLKLDEDFRPLAFTSDGEIEGEVVFAGYGLSIPGDAGKGYDSYANLDVADKIVYVPEAVSVERRQELNRSASLQFKALAARKQGAKGLLVVTGPTSPNAGELVSLSFDQGMGSAGIQAVSISGKTAEKLFAAAGNSGRIG